MNQKYDVMVIGPVSLDHNIDYEGNERNEIRNPKPLTALSM